MLGALDVGWALPSQDRSVVNLSDMGMEKRSYPITLYLAGRMVTLKTGGVGRYTRSAGGEALSGEPGLLKHEVLLAMTNLCLPVRRSRDEGVSAQFLCTSRDAEQEMARTVHAVRANLAKVDR
jgi:hypothetical protein